MKAEARVRPHGFTLIELMIVVAVIAIVLSIAIPSVQAARKSANEAKALASLKAIASAFEMRRLRTASYGGGISNLQMDGYIDGFSLTTHPNTLRKGDYVFTRFNTSVAGGPYFVRASPETPDAGDRHFVFFVEDGFIRYSTIGPATQHSPALP